MGVSAVALGIQLRKLSHGYKTFVVSGKTELEGNYTANLNIIKYPIIYNGAPVFKSKDNNKVILYYGDGFRFVDDKDVAGYFRCTNLITYCTHKYDLVSN